MSVLFPFISFNSLNKLNNIQVKSVSYIRLLCDIYRRCESCGLWQICVSWHPWKRIQKWRVGLGLWELQTHFSCNSNKGQLSYLAVGTVNAASKEPLLHSRHAKKKTHLMLASIKNVIQSRLWPQKCDCRTSSSSFCTHVN